MFAMQSTSTFDIDTTMDVDDESVETRRLLLAANVSPSTSAASVSDVRTLVRQREIKLTSILQLRTAIENDMHSGTLRTTIYV